MPITLPDLPATVGLSELELACALFAQGEVGRVGGADLAGVDFFSFQKALAKRRISTLTIDDLHHDIAALNELLPGPKFLFLQSEVVVLADTSVLLNLCRIGQERLLVELYQAPLRFLAFWGNSPLGKETRPANLRA